MFSRRVISNSMRLARRAICTVQAPSVARSAIRTSTLRAPISRVFARGFAVEVEKVPSLGDSITEGSIVSWQKNVGEAVNVDDVLVVIETDKVSVDIRATKAGVLTWQGAAKGDTVSVGQELAKIDSDAKATVAVATAAKPAAAAPTPAAAAPAAPTPAAAAPTPAPAAKAAAPAAAAPAKEAKPTGPAPTAVLTTTTQASRTERRVPMTRMRQTIARRLKDAQNTYALLTTFNEIDMSGFMSVRDKYKDAFVERHGVKLGFMSVFVKAASAALQKTPEVNAVIDGTDIVYRDYVDISVAVSTPTGLVVPVLRNCETMTFAGVEASIAALGQKARKGQIALEDMAGGTFTISNGGVYGSLFGTPIVNPPQSAILGMHGVFKRPVAVGDKVEIRPMMYVALTYDHRIIDGSQAVTFLKDIKTAVEEPTRLLLDL